MQLDSQQSAQEHYYKKIAVGYDARFKRENPNHIYKIQNITDCFFRHFSDQTRRYSFMEIGAGTGIHAEYFLARYAARISRYLLTDLSPQMLEVAAQRTARFSDLTSFLVTPAEQLLTEEKFDGIFMSGAMHHFSDPHQALVGFKNHLTEGGLVVVCEPIVSNVYNFFNALSTGKDWGQFHVTRATIRRYMRELSYEIVEDKVLHYNWRSHFMATLLPNRKLEQIALLDSQAVMFLLAGRVN